MRPDPNAYAHECVPDVSDCPNNSGHTPEPWGYIARAVWACQMMRTHRQIKCPDCGLYKIWIRKQKCGCPARCKHCGRRRSRDADGHYCKTQNCQSAHGYAGCTWARS